MKKLKGNPKKKVKNRRKKEAKSNVSTMVFCTSLFSFLKSIIDLVLLL